MAEQKSSSNHYWPLDRQLGAGESKSLPIDPLHWALLDAVLGSRDDGRYAMCSTETRVDAGRNRVATRWQQSEGIAFSQTYFLAEVDYYNNLVRALAGLPPGGPAATALRDRRRAERAEQARPPMRLFGTEANVSLE
jgi:hypothetical protein